MKKIGILTFHNVPNYGAVLQAYALKTFLEKYSDNEVSVLNFQCSGNSNEFDPEVIKSNIMNRPGKIIKKFIKLVQYNLFTNKLYSTKVKGFFDFRTSYLNIDNDLDSLQNNYDLLVCGSDQIWNPNITNGFQDYYFGCAKNQQGVRTISYAASCGNVEEITKNDESEFFKRIACIAKVGVREKSLADYLIKKGNEVSYNVDPTFLLDKKDYISEFSLKKNEEKYILIYALQQNILLTSIANIISQNTGLPLKVVCGYMPKKKKKNNELYDVDPIGFLNLIYNADYVITNSFHGLAFSLIFRKKFNVVMPKSRASRLMDLLDELNLTNRVCIDSTVDMSDIDYSSVEMAFNSRIQESKHYLLEEIRRL